MRFRDGRPRPIAAFRLAARDRAGVSEASCTRAIMAAAVYTISSSPPIRHPHGTFRGTRLGQGTGAPTSRPAPAPHSGKRGRLRPNGAGCGMPNGGDAAARRPDEESASGGPVSRVKLESWLQKARVARLRGNSHV
ncbi:hypothetical protein OH687_04825 [Burkholderia anthina]|nr:hypothetical protein OH687_04825 [Burkholderia anthina]